MNLSRAFIGAGALFLLLFGVWHIVLAPVFLHPNSTFTTHLTYEAEGRTLETFPGPLVFGRFTEEHATRVTASRGSILQLETTTQFFDAASGKAIFNDTSQLWVDSDTLRLENSDVYAIFPHAPPKDDLRVKQFPYLPDSGVVFRFKGEEIIDGETVYRYDFNVEGLDWTGSYGFSMPTGSRIVAQDQGSVWIEPTTGTLIKHEELWESRVSGGPHDGTLVDVGRMWMTHNTILRQVFLAQNDHRKHRLYEWIIPGFLLTASVLFAVVGLRAKEG